MSLGPITAGTHRDSLGADKPLIEVGLVLAGRFDAIARQAIQLARHDVKRELQHRFPDFEWIVDTVKRPEAVLAQREEPITLLDQGRFERDAYKWDFVVLITSVDLIGHEEPFTLAAVSRTLDLAVISTARIDPHVDDSSIADESRVNRISHRLRGLMLRCLGHLNGLDKSSLQDRVTQDHQQVDEFDGESEYTDAEIRTMTENLLSVADLRLEEQADVNSLSQFKFQIRAAWTQRHEILAGVLEAEPWQFPFRLSRLTTAAFSAMLVLMIAAETWELAMSQSLSTLAALHVVALMSTTVYVLARQQLLVRRHGRHLTEQIAISNLTTSLTVFCGLLTTLVVLLAASFLLSQLLFPRSLVADWSESPEARISSLNYLRMCGVVSGFSLCVGALGATFENQAYFRHVILVDEEL